MALVSVSVETLTPATLNPGMVLNCLLTVINGTGATAIDHIEFPIVDADGSPAPGVSVSAPPLGANSPYVALADSATVKIPFSLVAYSPGSTSIGTGASAAGNVSRYVKPIVYTTAGEVMADDGNGQQLFNVTPISWATGGGG